MERVWNYPDHFHEINFKTSTPFKINERINTLITGMNPDIQRCHELTEGTCLTNIADRVA